MIPTDFEGTNIILSKPSDMTDEQCLSVKAFHGLDNDNFPFFLTAWIPNKEDLEAINAGRPIMLKVIGRQMVPVCIYTCDENGECNSSR